ncbi:MAG: 50S ribosomal protein L11 methyltransferase [Candidatus Latescibacterota bacterium]
MPAARVEDVAACCHELGSCGLQHRDQGPDARLEAYFDAAVDLPVLLGGLQEGLRCAGLGHLSVDVSQVVEEDWEAGWRRHFGPVQVTPRLWVRPPWAALDPAPGRIAVTIEPRMAFGTGGHESTQLCLQALEKHLRPGASCLDLGTGSGVLAIAAALLGAGRVLALDVDAVAVASARDSVRLNGLEGGVVTVREGSLAQAGAEHFDLVLANIHSQVLRPLLGAIAARLRPAGVAVLSGLLAAEEAAFRGCMEAAALRPGETLERGGWICLAGTRGA